VNLSSSIISSHVRVAKMSHVSEMPLPVREAIEKLNTAISADATLKGSIVNALERYLGDSLWPSNFRELEKALDRLAPELARALRICLLITIEEFDSWQEQLPDELATFLRDLQECYSYKYRVAAYRTVLSDDGYDWYTMHVQCLSKRDRLWCGISIVRNDGEHVYFGGDEESIKKLVRTIQGVMERARGGKAEEA